MNAAEATKRARELHSKARVTVGGSSHRPVWRVYVDMTFSLDGTTSGDGVVQTEALIAEGRTPIEVLEKFYNWRHDPEGEAFYRNRVLRGESVHAPFPESAAQKALRENHESRQRHLREEARMAARRQLRVIAKRQGWLERALRDGVLRGRE